jgi:hypothetical protein
MSEEETKVRIELIDHLEAVENILTKSPIELKKILGETRGGIRGEVVLPLFFPDDEIIENSMEWVELLLKTQILYRKKAEELEKPISFEEKGLISAERVLTAYEKKYILEGARASEMSKLASVLLVLTPENIKLLKKSYEDIKFLFNHLENASEKGLLEFLEEKGLYPLKVKEREKISIAGATTEEIKEKIQSLSQEIQDKEPEIKERILNTNAKLEMELVETIEKEIIDPVVEDVKKVLKPLGKALSITEEAIEKTVEVVGETLKDVTDEVKEFVDETIDEGVKGVNSVVDLLDGKIDNEDSIFLNDPESKDESEDEDDPFSKEKSPFDED